MAGDSGLGPDPSWEKYLKPKMVKVAEQLCPRRHNLVPRLYAADLINSDEEQEFSLSQEADTKLALKILRVLRKQGPGSFDKFCDVLRDVEDGSLCDVERVLRPRP
ncbi:caspase-2-like [Corticium candelabrum]|uniref:caspase-2-like n=1 Tax=Corticium candelabrum TaxID=121492 RepID=UPI002E2F4226|nr:caspase-2-like [Corticium candelabrum]